jgi:uncharacterized peroxidase-related enzyme
MDFGRESGNRELARQLVYDHRDAAGLDPADRALCDYAVKLTLAPGAMAEADVRRLREHDFSDEAITVATQVIGYFNYINRVADGLGVDDELGMTPPRPEWLRRKGRGYAAGP